MPRRQHRSLRNQRQVETLESRNLLAAFGTPWPDARNLSISFPADGVGIDAYDNVMRQSLDAVTDRGNWQELAIRAFQTWAIHADINVGLRADHDLDFGAPGLSIHDPRFGEFRLGAFPQPGVLANSLPFQAVAGTWSGDLFLNSQELFQYHDWFNGLPPDTSSQPAQARDLFSVLLHETGNVLGIADTTDASAVMFGHYAGPKGLLTPADIGWLQSLYGQRTDPYEQVNNGQLNLATLVPTPVGFDPSSERLSVRGSILDSGDVDFYRVSPAAGQTEVTLTINAAGVSLLKPRIEVYDQNGVSLAQQTAISVFNNDVTLTLTDLESHGDLSIRVSAADDGIYSAGDYYLLVDYRSTEVRDADPVAGGYDFGAERLGDNFKLMDDEVGINDSVLTAMALASAEGFDLHSRYEWTSSVSGSEDVDFWKIKAPSQINGRLVVTLASVGIDAPDLRVRVVDANGYSVGASGRLRRDGTWVLEVTQPQADAEYLIRIAVDTNSAVDVGNYVASAEFVTDAQQMNYFVSGTVSTAMDNVIRWTSAKTRFYRFDLWGFGATPDKAVQVTIYDAATQEVRLVLGTPSGNTRSAFVLLSQGDYILRFTAISRDGSAVASVGYYLMSDGISDDQNPNSDGNDPDFYNYYYDDPVGYYYYTGNPNYYYTPWYEDYYGYNYGGYGGADDGSGSTGGGSSDGGSSGGYGGGV